MLPAAGRTRGSPCRRRSSRLSSDSQRRFHGDFIARGFTLTVNQNRIALRDAGVRKLRRLTTAAAAGAGVLALVSAGLAAKAFPGRSSHTAALPVRRATPGPARLQSQSPPPVVSIGAPASSAAPPASAPTPPAPTSAPPTVVSGGS